MKIWLTLTVLSVLLCVFVGYRNFLITEPFKVIEEYQKVGDSDENLPPSYYDSELELEVDSDLLNEMPMTVEDLKSKIFNDLKFSEFEILQIQTERLQWELKVIKFKVKQLNSTVNELKKEKQVRESSLDNMIKIVQTIVPLLVPLVTFKHRKKMDKPLEKREKRKNQV